MKDRETTPVQSTGRRVTRRSLVKAASQTLAAGSLALGAVGAAAAEPKPQPSSGGRFAGRIALVTGGARGIGRGIALRLAQDGADVIVCDIAKPIPTIPYPMATRADLDETIAMIEATGRRSLGVQADVRDPAAVNALVARGVKEFGKIDFLVANAGVLAQRPLPELDDRTFDDVIRTNLYGTFQCIRAVVPAMAERKYGRVVAISSRAGRVGHATLPHYCASKWGIIGLVKSLALEYAAQGVTINAVCPSGTKTMQTDNELTWRRALPDDSAPTSAKYEAFRKATRSTLPQGQVWLYPEEIAATVAYLMSDDAARITGSAIDVSGGRAADISA